jgi:hypothetical protein
VKFIIMQFSPWSVFLPFKSKYLPQHSVLKNPQSVFLPQSERPKRNRRSLQKCGTASQALLGLIVKQHSLQT